MVAIETTSAFQATAFWTDLTPSERQVGAAMARGWINSKIANQLALSPKTVENRVSAIYDKLPEASGVHRRVQAVLLIASMLQDRAPSANESPA